MKIFLDTADYDAISMRYDTGLIDGVTTNPSLIKKSGDDPFEAIKAISESFPDLKSISAEVVADLACDMIEQAKPFMELDNVTIKVPCTVEGLNFVVNYATSVQQSMLPLFSLLPCCACC